MVLPPEIGPRRPLLVRFALGGIHTRTTAWRYVWISAGMMLFAAAIGDPTLIGIALLGVAAFAGSIWWMDRHDAWDTEPAQAPRAIRRGTPDTAVATPRRGAPRDPGATAASPTAPVGRLARLLSPVTTPSRAAAVLAGMSTVVFLFALTTLEAAGPLPAGMHLVSVVVDALFGVVFGGAATLIALRRPNVPFERASTLLASTGLALVASLGFYVASDGLTTTSEAVGLGAGAGVLILTFGSGAAFWLTARSGGWIGWAAAIPVLLIGWYLGISAWIAHINSS